MNKQKRYEQTEKGKAARQRAVATYKAKLVRWDCMIEPELSDSLMAKKPADMNKTAFMKMILEKFAQRG